MKSKPALETLILTLRQQKVILDADLAGLYGVPTKRLNEQVKRSAERFPADFVFQPTAQEWSDLKSQIATSSLEGTEEPKSHGPDRALPSFILITGGASAALVGWREMTVSIVTSILRSV